MKYNKSTVNKIIAALADGQGRVAAAKGANISFETFCQWMGKYSEFSDKVKKAQEIGYAKVHDICKHRIINDASWQSAAWWLERTDPANFGQRNNLNVTAESPLIVVADEETKKLLEKLSDQVISPRLLLNKHQKGRPDPCNQKNAH